MVVTVIVLLKWKTTVNSVEAAEQKPTWLVCCRKGSVDSLSTVFFMSLNNHREQIHICCCTLMNFPLSFMSLFSLVVYKPFFHWALPPVFSNQMFPLQQGWNIIKYNCEVLYMNIYILCFFIHPLHYISEGNILLSTSLHSFHSYRY